MFHQLKGRRLGSVTLVTGMPGEKAAPSGRNRQAASSPSSKIGQHPTASSDAATPLAPTQSIGADGKLTQEEMGTPPPQGPLLLLWHTINLPAPTAATHSIQKPAAVGRATFTVTGERGDH